MIDPLASPGSAPLIVIAGPTASGKSALALRVARRFNGVVINADSMQVYRDLRILSARPSVEDEAAAPHALYGVLDGAEVCSVGRWLALADGAVAAARAAGRLPILCGGTGLYLKAALEGLASVPEVAPEVRAEARELLATLGPAALHAKLAELDRAMAERLRPSDAQRIARAYEVVRGTGRSLMDWWSDPVATPALPGRSLLLVVDPPRAAQRAACDGRLAAMVAAGALDELALLLARRLDPALPVMRAVGVPELAQALRGEVALAEAVERAQGATRRYAKRQGTWIRTQLRPDRVLSESLVTQLSESQLTDIDNFLYAFLLTGAS
ncbi:tRNA (adenosine(37)-N6)-dimethylallyltransferase MiaA [Rhodospirillum rubrum]|uniref:tRNA (adenosine(37)-N6)-dimethylallyltransferase MiaA n=1 Tax=Rhodospirillum rubrum TaxID=1085 RepID=UPI001905643E|nr:tRNA (adenosine(37)-N6)-dimethylallyltransferase MiaA [Rhodospirillum rubrum]MBK1663372.1 tRNA (adenosine(37)-N6)-dimethylallyltransferase MiaA [Rhodospirillum rubrum]MBK1675544.1 tRNA (adenosine(37)-N6)-dimethylallyltransferase MiaA [Rhodospirillum rubrum]